MGGSVRGTAAIGGSVQAGSPYLVGERGQEIFVPNQSGSIVPNNKLGGGGVVLNQTINVTTGVSQTVRAEIANLMPQIANATKGAVADARMRGGSYSKALIGA
jgi:phage-related minor tail protein